MLLKQQSMGKVIVLNTMYFGVFSSYSEMILIIYTWFWLNLWRWCDGNLYKLAWKDKSYGGIKPIHTAIGGWNKTVAGAPDFHNYYHGQKDKTFKIRPKNVLHQIHVKCLQRQFIKFKLRTHWQVHVYHREI